MLLHVSEEYYRGTNSYHHNNDTLDLDNEDVNLRLDTTPGASRDAVCSQNLNLGAVSNVDWVVKQVLAQFDHHVWPLGTSIRNAVLRVINHIPKQTTLPRRSTPHITATTKLSQSMMLSLS